MMRSLAAALLVTLAACTAAPNGETLPTEAGPGSSEPSTAPPSTLPPVVECPGAGEFAEGGGIARFAGQDSDSTTLGRISWRTSDRCESFAFEFQTAQGAPATTPPSVRIGHLDGFQVIRIGLGVAGSVLVDQLVETDLVERLYVVGAPDGTSFVDLHLARPAAARARVAASPARLTIDLRPGFVDFAGEAAIDDDVVLVSPQAGAEVEPLTGFLGYARQEASPVTLVVTQGGEVVAEAQTLVADSELGWGEFRHQILLPTGELVVFVGLEGPDGAIVDGVTVDLTVG